MPDRDQGRPHERREDPRLEDWTILVSAADGAPIEGALVSVQRADGILPRAAFTDQAGRVAFRVRPGAPLVVGVEAAGFVTGRGSVVALEEQPLRIVMARVAPPAPVHPNPIRGRLRIDRNAFVHDAGDVLPHGIHWGNGLALFAARREVAEREADHMRSAGWPFVRTWTGHSGPWWEKAGSVYGPLYDPHYWETFETFVRMLAARSIKLAVSQGDIAQFGSWEERLAAARRFAEIEQRVGGYPYAFFDAGNEAWQTGEPDIDRLAAFIAAYKAAGGAALCTLTSPPGEGRAELLAYSVPPADLYDVHGSRDGYWYDKARHIGNVGYESMPDRVGIQSEGPGTDHPSNGVLVSVTEHPEDLRDPETMTLLAVMSMIGRQAWVHFSGEGIVDDPSLEPDLAQPTLLPAEAGFWEVPSALRALPPDLMRFEQQIHAGSRWAGTRVFRCDDPEVRIDGRLSSDGRFVFAAYGPSGLRVLHVERPCEVNADTGETWRLDAGVTVTLAWTRGRVLQGRLR